MPPPSAAAVFGPRLAMAVEFARLLATDGVERGLLGPQEVPRLWERHLLNCAVVAEIIAPGARAIDVGSGAGLPGVALALARPDLSMVLLEPMARRCAFLVEVVQRLGMAQVEVRRGRAEDGPRRPGADVAVSRAVAKLDPLVGWCLPLIRVGGRVLAMKGATAATELSHAAAVIHSAGGRHCRIRRCGVGVVDPPAIVVEILRGSLGH
ncbi:MAG: 16S rRNA (guanine(527)-N(7))-methyltransferase RsmG [Actinomycetota bacterium]|nr:16S rRNA (guanine(527)-N(7))-methyltransferase RsmG [Actinomycetota bacterium]